MLCFFHVQLSVYIVFQDFLKKLVIKRKRDSLLYVIIHEINLHTVRKTFFRT